MRVVRTVLILVMALLIACPVLAQEKKKGRRGPGFDPTARLLEGINLTDEQKTKIDAVKKEFAPKEAELAKKRGAILTDDQKKARADAEKAAKDAGKTPREVARAAREAVTLTDEQKTKMADVGKEGRELMTQRMDKIKAILTPEQKEQVEKRIEEFKSKMGKKKRD